jgi:hypothetical protein
LRHRRGFSIELVPACALSAACLTADRRKRRFFGPRRSYRILQHDLTHGHDLCGLLLHSRPGLAAPLRSRSSLARCRVESRVDLRYRLDEPSRAHPPCALLHGSVSELDGPVHARRSRSRHLSSAKTLPYYLRRPTRHPLNFDCGNTGRRSRAKDWHVPLPGCGGVRCEFPSSRASEHPAVADLVRVVLEWMYTWPPTGQDFRSGDTPRRMALSRESGCLEPFLGHDGRGDCSPEDHSSLGLRLTASDRPLGDAALFTRTLPTERPMLFELASGRSSRPPLPWTGRAVRRTLGAGLPVGFPTWEATHPSIWNGHYEQQLAV